MLEEVQCGDPAFAAARVERLRGIPMLPETGAVRELAERLLREQIIPVVAADDAAHRAFAATHALDYLLTWNGKHINNPHPLRRIEQACAVYGLPCPVICTRRNS